MKNIIFALLFSVPVYAQRPQNIDIGKGRNESIWDSPWTIALLVGFVILMIVSRSWSKKIHARRDSESEKDKKEKN
jgi:hypothetical protein